MGKTINELKKICHENAIAKGWWSEPREPGTLIALMHSELSEALEYMRKGFDSESNHIAPFTGVEEELADVIIRILNFAKHYDLDIEGAIDAKIKYNSDRPFKHGGKEF